jgi:hypothetical protein
VANEPIFQPAGSGRFASELLTLLSDPAVTALYAVVAFATLDGVLLLGPNPGGALYEFLERGGSIDLLVGADSVTTEDALRTLRRLS